ncbi:glycosyltransferase [Erythrobacter alti]|uniref:glycosyltransferase n=1 Tax=Erythrobacter alti TaxID=1896145 RepID=UPI0030F49599
MNKRFVAWGAYDDGKPRVRLLLESLRKAGRLEAEIHVPVWSDVADKSVAGKRQLFRAAFRYLTGMPRALWRLARLPGDAGVLLPYPGTPDIFAASLLARINGRAVVLDAFLPIHDTIVRDRKLASERGLEARFLRLFEKAGLMCADVILVDTDAHGDFLSREYAIPADRFITVHVGAETLFDPQPDLPSVDHLVPHQDGSPVVLFYGQFIPLHGLATILEAVRLTQDDPIHWVIIGKGQEEPIMRHFLAEKGSRRLLYLPWVKYERLPAMIARADLCLGIFGGSDKASRVIPNKVFQCLAMGKPVVTRSGPAMSPLAQQHPQTIITVPPEDPQALADAVRNALGRADRLTGLPDAAMRELSPEAGVARLLAKLESA